MLKKRFLQCGIEMRKRSLEMIGSLNKSITKSYTQLHTKIVSDRLLFIHDQDHCHINNLSFNSFNYSSREKFVWIMDSNEIRLDETLILELKFVAPKTWKKLFLKVDDNKQSSYIVCLKNNWWQIRLIERSSFQHNYQRILQNAFALYVKMQPVYMRNTGKSVLYESLVTSLLSRYISFHPLHFCQSTLKNLHFRAINSKPQRFFFAKLD